jgi:hypothetical protein
MRNIQTCSIAYADLVLAMVLLLSQIEILKMSGEMVSCTGVRILEVLGWQCRCGVITLWIGRLVLLMLLGRLGLFLSVLTTDCRVTRLATNLAGRLRRCCIWGEIGTTSSVAIKGPAHPIVRTTATTTEASSVKI